MDDIKRLGSLFGHTGGSFAGLVYNPDGLAPAINTAGGGLRMPLIIEIDKERKSYIMEDQERKLKIRKLIPEECFKLMGLTEDDCQKCREVGCSNTQLYCIAGNGLITNCVELITEHLYKAIYDETYECDDESKELMLTID